MARRKNGLYYYDPLQQNLASHEVDDLEKYAYTWNRLANSGETDPKEFRKIMARVDTYTRNHNIRGNGIVINFFGEMWSIIDHLRNNKN